MIDVNDLSAPQIVAYDRNYAHTGALSKVRATHQSVDSNFKENTMSVALEAYLDEQGVKYITMRHSAAYSAHELAVMLHVADRELAKTVLVKADGEPAMVVLPANHRIDFHLLKEELRANTVTMASEDEIGDILPDCEVGAMPPFGNLFGLPVYVARPLTADEEIVFNDGTLTTAIRMSYRDFDRLAHPNVIDIIADE